MGIMRNISEMCKKEERKKKIQFFINKMQNSGYNSEERAKVYKSAKKKYDDMLKRDQEGETPLYREKNWNRLERLKEKEKKKKSWYKSGKNEAEAVFFVR